MIQGLAVSAGTSPARGYRDRIVRLLRYTSDDGIDIFRVDRVKNCFGNNLVNTVVGSGNNPGAISSFAIAAARNLDR